MESIIKINIGTLNVINRNKGVNMTTIIIAFLICLTIIICSIARFCKFERAEYTINVTVEDRATAEWLLEKLPPSSITIQHPSKKESEQVTSDTEQSENG